jgi:feruloyl esterase
MIVAIAPDLLLHGAATIVCAAALNSLSSAQAPLQPPPADLKPASLSEVVPVTDCGKLAQADIRSAVGAETHITAADPVTDGMPSPYCRVTGYIMPMVRFEVRLPLNTWTQRFVQTGCGGLCGNLNIRLGNAEGCYPANHGDIALASTDMGHTGGTDGKFGEDERLRIDFAYRGVHVTTLAAKALISTFYGQGPKYSYFSGCSDGGREALMEAERFPQDFNGITAGAPAMNFTTQNTFYHGWNAVQNTGADGKPILTADKLPILHRAVLAACDAADGLKDGLISDPVSCHFDPAVVERKGADKTTGCLTHAQAETARAIYEGAHDDHGEKLVLSGPLPGSELAWAGVYVPPPGDDHIMSAMISTGSLKNLVYPKNPPATYTLKELQFTPESFQQTTRLHGLYDATDPDLGAFAKNGGKLILWHGLADPHISPLNTIAYYTAMNKVMGESAVRQFARLYLFPGGYHCGNGEGPFTFDLMSTVMAWVEQGTAPDAIIAAHEKENEKRPVAGAPSETPSGGRPSVQAPLPGGPSPSAKHDQPEVQGEKGANPNVHRTRPISPYPLTVKYKGTGSINDANNFAVGPTHPVPAAKLSRLGSSFYSPHYELWCQADETAPRSCKSNP